MTASAENEEPLPGPPARGSRLVESASAVVALGALLALVAIVSVAIVSLPSGSGRAGNIVTVTTAALGVLGALAGSFFAVRSADRAVNQMAAQQIRRDEGGSRRPGSSGGGR
jgi:hypothetical protein